MIETALAFVLGLLIGSFLNVCISRLPQDLSVVCPRSYCPRCEHTIAWYDNIPVLSYLVLLGRCRHCRGRIPFRYPLVELLTAGLFAAAVQMHGLSLATFKLSFFAALLVALIFSDLDWRILPDEFTIGGMVAGFLMAIWIPMEPGIASALLSTIFEGGCVSAIESALGAAFLGGVLWAVGWLYQKVRKREGLGLGDVKMIAMMGAFLGLHQTLFTLILGSIAGSVIGLLYILLARKDASTYELPYGTFLGAAALFYVFVWHPLIEASPQVLP